MKKETSIKELSIDEIQAELKSRKAKKKAVISDEKKAVKGREKESKKLIEKANIKGIIARHIIDMKNVKVNGCNVRMSTPLHVKTVFTSELCKANCDCFSTCESIINLTGKKSRKVNGEKTRLTDARLTRKEYKGKLTFTYDNGKIHTYEGNNWKAVTDKARIELKSLYSLTKGQCQAVGHKGKARKAEIAFNG